MERSHKLVLTNWTSANNALMQRYGGNKSELAKRVKMSRTTVTAFFSQQPIGEGSFRKICLALGLNWQAYSSTDSRSDALEESLLSPVQSEEIDSEQVVDHCRQQILERHAQMRLLSGEEVSVEQLYVDVWLLGKPERRHFNTSESLLRSFDIKEDRLALSKRIQRTPGFAIANSNSKLVILGKPGSGKTTFLKQIAVDWCNGKFQPQTTAVLIELRKVQKNTWHIIDAIDKELGFENWRQAEPHKQRIEELRSLISRLGLDEEAIKEKNKLNSHVKTEEEKLEDCRADTEDFLANKGLLILMDGLDEIPTSELRQKVQKQINEVSETYSGNRFILTCRTQIISIIPSNFVSVEVADFNLIQIRQFVQNWFMADGQSEAEALQQSEILQQAIADKPDLKEMTATPVLLSLICVVWKDTGEIPTNRTNLYKRGINWLLRRWNEGKEIVGWEVGSETYRQLSIEDKEALLIEIAARKFESAENFVLFEQNELVEQISQILQLSDVREGLAVLRAIEAQHGLLIERADELWSFSHLTFQEHFTIQWLTRLPSDQLTDKIADQQWKMVMEQLVKSQQPADRLIRLLKRAIDQSVAREPTIQNFFCWLLKKSNSFQPKYEPVSIRAFYYSLTCSRSLKLDSSLPRLLELELSRFLDPDFDLDFDLDRQLSLDLSLDGSLNCSFEPDRALELNRFLDLDRALDRSLDLSRSRPNEFALDIARSIARSTALNLSPVFISSLRQLKDELPTSNRLEEIQNWQLLHGSQWVSKFRQVIITYRDIGHDWNFTEKQQKQLQRYQDAIKFLINLTEIGGAVSEACRAEVKEGLLLDWTELERRYPQYYEKLPEI